MKNVLDVLRGREKASSRSIVKSILDLETKLKGAEEAYKEAKDALTEKDQKNLFSAGVSKTDLEGAEKTFERAKRQKDVIQTTLSDMRRKLEEVLAEENSGKQYELDCLLKRRQALHKRMLSEEFAEAVVNLLAIYKLYYGSFEYTEGVFRLPLLDSSDINSIHSRAKERAMEMAKKNLPSSEYYKVEILINEVQSDIRNFEQISSEDMIEKLLSVARIDAGMVDNAPAR